MAGLRSVPLALGLLLSLLAAPAQAQTHTCGDIQLVFRNPDLQPGGDGFIRAQGQFFAQFQAIGPDAGKIAVFGFSFGPQAAEFDEAACGTAPAPWVTGAYIPNYRADRDATDGYFIPLKTPLVPDGTYAAAVHAYDASNNELARFWAKAIVDNCDDAPTPAQEKCDDDPAQMVKHDKTAPWPIILPGDGQALTGHQLTIEFGEELAGHTVYLNGKDITAELKAWPGREWDADYAPDYGPSGLGSIVAPPCTGAPGQACETYGPAFEWVGRPLVDSDVIRVEATDKAGNKAVKDVHIGSSVAGGAVTDDLPNLSYSVDHLQTTAGAGKSALYHFQITNNGGGTGHPFAEAKVPSGWTYEWQPVHVVVPPGETKAQELVVTVPANTPDGRYSVNATLTYTAGGVTKVLAQPLDVLVGNAAAGTPTSTESSTTTAKKSPGAWPLAALVLAGLAVALRRRA